MNALHAFHDDHLLDALAADLNAAVYEALVHEDMEPMVLDDADQKTILSATADGAVKSAGTEDRREKNTRD
jgi:hypothetical protein